MEPPTKTSQNARKVKYTVITCMLIAIGLLFYRAYADSTDTPTFDDTGYYALHDDAGRDYRVDILTDPNTGCEYFKYTPGGGPATHHIMPRIDAYGNVAGCKYIERPSLEESQ